MRLKMSKTLLFSSLILSFYTMEASAEVVGAPPPPPPPPEQKVETQFSQMGKSLVRDANRLAKAHTKMADAEKDYVSLEKTCEGKDKTGTCSKDSFDTQRAKLKKAAEDTGNALAAVEFQMTKLSDKVTLAKQGIASESREARKVVKFAPSNRPEASFMDELLNKLKGGVGLEE
jgi:hypothetical protein